MSGLKDKLFKLYEEGIDGHGKHHSEGEYDTMIRFGAKGILTEDYYLFLYRDMYRKRSYYGAVLFLNKRDKNNRILTIKCFEENGIENERPVYIYAAIYFLKNEFKNLLQSNPKIEYLIELSKSEIKGFYSGKTQSVFQNIDSFDYNIKGQEIKFREYNFDDKTKITKKEKSSITMIIDSMAYNEGKAQKKIKVRKLKVALKILKKNDLLTKSFLHFTPYYQYKSTNKTIQEFSTKDFDTLYLIDEEDKALMQYINQYKSVESVAMSEIKKQVILNNLSFDILAKKFFENNSDKLFFITENNKFEKVKTGVFKEILVKFAPLITGNKFTLFLDITLENKRIIRCKDSYIVKNFKNSSYIFIITSGDEYFLLKPADFQEYEKFMLFLDYSKKHYDLWEFEQVLDGLKKITPENVKIREELLKLYEFTILPVPILKILIKVKDRKLTEILQVEFDYEEAVKGYLKNHQEKEVIKFAENINFENACLKILQNDKYLSKDLTFINMDDRTGHIYNFENNESFEWLIGNGEKYLNRGFKIFSEERGKFINNIRGALSISVKTNINWLEFRPEIENDISGEKKLIKSIINEEKGIIEDNDGDLHIITKEEIERLKNILLYGDKSGGNYRIPSSNFALINKLYDRRMNDIPEINTLLAKNKKLSEFDKIGNYKISKDFKGKLREYQKSGFDWLNFLREYGFSGCLADDMGLGKTIQTIAFLQSLKSGNRLQTSVLVVPVSAISNWESEINKFSKNLIFLTHIGVKRKKTSKSWKGKDLIITSYATLRNDIEIFKDFEFDFIILDESQNIKNPLSQTSKAVKLLKAKSRLALSGTPIENNTYELWSLFDFLTPGYLGTLSWFKKKFDTQIQILIDNSYFSERNEILKKMIFPFMLRRKKEDVESELPPKTIIIQKLKMSEEQRKIYEETAKKIREDLNKKSKELIKKSPLQILEGILRLRQVCLFPELAKKEFENAPSIKFDFFKEQIRELKAEGHKVLVFSQFKGVLTLLKENIKEEEITYSYIDGSTPQKKRKEEIAKFQENDETSVFLLSLKAGGVAINLTKADYVIIFDPWWNPAAEAQAIDRSHRIGQNKHVFVYKLVVENSIEEKILLLQEKKKELFENIITTDSLSVKDLSKDELLDLFK